MTSFSTIPDGYFPPVPEPTKDGSESIMFTAISSSPATLPAKVPTQDQTTSCRTEQPMFSADEEEVRADIALLKSKIDTARNEHDRVVCSSRRTGGFLYSQLQRTVECSLTLLPRARTDAKWVKRLKSENLRLLWEVYTPYLSKASTYDNFSRLRHTRYQSDGETDQSEVVKMLETELAEVMEKLALEQELNSGLCARAQSLSAGRQQLEDGTRLLESAIWAVKEDNKTQEQLEGPTLPSPKPL